MAFWPHEQATQWRTAGGVGLQPVGGLVGDRGGVQGQRWPSPQAGALAARSGLAGGGLATRATGRIGGCMVVVCSGDLELKRACARCGTR
jgi:hypothetical protein